MSIIRTTTLSLKENNSGKLSELQILHDYYKEAVQYYLDYYWTMNFTKHKFLNEKAHTFYPYDLNCNSPLTARAQRRAADQALSIINAETNKQRKRLYQIQKFQREDKLDKATNIQRIFDKHGLNKPVLPKFLPMELNSNNCVITDSCTQTFDINIELHALYISKRGQKINLVAKSHRHANKLASSGKRMTSILLHQDGVDIRFEIQVIPKQKKSGVKLGIDQGIASCISVASSDTNVLCNHQSVACPHGHTLSSIIQKKIRCKKGSKAFKRAQDHETNHINWCVNQLNLTDVSEIALEKLYKMRLGVNAAPTLKYFCYTKIKNKIISICEVNGVHFTEQSNAYRSQRCNACGFVHTKNRTAKTFKCRSCGHKDDSDMNASKNHSVDLPELMSGLGLNRTSGFFWNTGFEGVYSPFLSHNYSLL